MWGVPVARRESGQYSNLTRGSSRWCVVERCGEAPGIREPEHKIFSLFAGFTVSSGLTAAAALVTVAPPLVPSSGGWHVFAPASSRIPYRG
jgi:hypothetical protein